MRTIIIALLLSSPALADKPRALTPLDLAQLDAALAHIDAIDAEARQRKAPYVDRAQAICQRYGFSCAEIGTVVQINPDTGAITDRRPPPPKPKAEPAKK